MSIRIKQRFGEMPDSPDEAYKPYFSMRDELDKLIQKNIVPTNSVPRVVDSLRSGIMPEKGAIVGLGSGVCGGFDLVTIEYVSEKEAVVVPAPKSAVDDESDRIVKKGGIAYTDDLENLKIADLIVPPNGLGEYRGRSVYKIGDLFLSELGIDAPSFKIKEEDSGLLVGRLPVAKSTFFLNSK